MTQPLTTRPGERARIFVHRTRALALLACTSLAGVSLSGCVSAALDDYGPGEGGTGGTESGSADSLGESGGEPSGGEGEPNSECEELQAEALDVLKRNCANCHNPILNEAGFDFVTDLDKLLLSGMIIEGQASDSPLFSRMTDGTMPPANELNQPSDEDISAVGKWIDSCPVNPVAECTERDWISTETIIDQMLKDIFTTSESDRPFIRYLTFTHLYNIGLCDEKLDRFRFGLNKAINSLSLNSIITVPEAIDDQYTIYRIDLRDYDWEVNQGVDKWEMLVDANPYAFRRLDEDSRALQDLTETTVPFMAADWLVHDASEPPLYYDLLDIPSTLAELEAQLGIDISENIALNRVARSGFKKSGVSLNNRLYEHHQLEESPGAFWLSYDFGNVQETEDEMGNPKFPNIFSNPTDFTEDGGEAIYNLPNGLQAYLITDATGGRLDEAPVKIVTDPKQPDKIVRAGISCMSCHDRGLKFKKDEILEHVTGIGSTFDQEIQDLVTEHHPPNEEMEDLIEQGNQIFASAIAKLWDGPTDEGEPIIEFFANFEGNIDLTRAAAEFGITPDDLSRNIGLLGPSYAPLVDGPIARDVFEAGFAASVCLLNLGEADDPECGS